MKHIQKVKIKILALCLMLFLSSGLSACGIFGGTTKYEYKENERVSFTEPFGASMQNTTPGFTTTTSYAKYHFTSESQIADRNRFVSNQEKIFAYLTNEGYMTNTVIYDCYLLDVYPFRAEHKTPRIFSEVTDIGTYQQVLVTLQAVSAPFANYGLLFGLSNYIAKQLRFSTETPNISSAKMLAYVDNSANINSLDMVYPCFDRDYTSDADVQYNQFVANTFVQYVIDNIGITSLRRLLNLHAESLTEFETEFVALKNLWLESINSRRTLQPTVNPILYQYNGQGCPLKIYTDRATYYILPSFMESKHAYYGESTLKGSYVEIKSVLQSVDSDFAKIEQELADENYIRRNVEIVLGSSVLTQNSNYSYDGNSILSKSLRYLVQTYTVHVMVSFDSVSLSWYRVAIGEYLSYQNEQYQIFLFNQLQQISFTTEKQRIENFLGRSYEKEDAYMYANIVCASNPNYTPTNNTQARISFVKYMIDSYGYEVAIDALRYPLQIEKRMGKGWNDMISDWSKYIKATYPI